MRSLFVRFASAAGVSLLVAGISGATVTMTRPVPQPALSTFGERTAAYAAVHRRVELTLPAVEAAESLRTLYRTRVRLALAIKAARPDAREGDIFTPAVGDAFRGIIEMALSGVDSEAFLRDLYEDQEAAPGFQPRVHDMYPDWATHDVPLILLERLPLLPEELEYRLIDHSLILWDADADLIIDVLADAIPRQTS